MSLLLDALQRASKEKEKSAAGAAVSTVAAGVAVATPAVIEPTVVPISFPDLHLDEPIEHRPLELQPEKQAKPMGLSSLQLSIDPLVESVTESAALTSQPTYLPDQQVNTVTFSVPPAVEASVSSSGAIAAAAPLLSSSENAGVIPAMADSPRGSAASPQVAREILTATTAATTSAVASKRKRLLVLVVAVVGGLLALGSVGLMLGLGDGLFDTVSTMGSPLRPLRQPMQPVSPTTELTTFAESSNTVQTPSNPTTPASQVASHENHETENTQDKSSTIAVPAKSSVKADRVSDAVALKSPYRAVPLPTKDQPLFVGRSANVGALEAGYVALTEGRFEEASIAYRLALRSNPEERDALLGLAYLAHRQGRLDEASALYQRVLRQDPKQPQALAGLLALQAVGDVSRATSQAREVVEQNPDSATALTALGHLLVREGRLADAQQAFFRALALEPEDALYAYNLAVALDRLHKYDLAVRYYENASGLAAHATSNVQAVFPRDRVQQRIEQLRARGRADALMP